MARAVLSRTPARELWLIAGQVDRTDGEEVRAALLNEHGTLHGVGDAAPQGSGSDSESDEEMCTGEEGVLPPPAVADFVDQALQHH